MDLNQIDATMLAGAVFSLLSAILFAYLVVKEWQYETLTKNSSKFMSIYFVISVMSIIFMFVFIFADKM